jgi:peptidoglycan/xylan/chitin deacetylase (PgdA/CDA1 family)
MNKGNSPLVDEFLEIRGSKPVYAAQARGVAAYLHVKRMVLNLCKGVGLFSLAGRLMRGGLLILCYHGFSLRDESAFSRRTFIDLDTFGKRMAFLKRSGFSVLSLDEALERLEGGTLPSRAVVITIDDGFYSVYAGAYPILRRHSFPATIYVTTYYAEQGNPVFNLAVQYMFWKTKKAVLDLGRLGMPETGLVSMLEEKTKTACLWRIIRFGEAACDEQGRVALSRALGEQLGVDYNSIVDERILTIMTFEQIQELSAAGMDIQLHTHRHILPCDRARALREIEDNRETLKPFVTRPLVHFCYPNGIWSREQWPWLVEARIRSAATGDRGWNYPAASPYGLKRVGDDSGLSSVEFEAELSGFVELFRRATRVLRATAGIFAFRRRDRRNVMNR